jgi:hypothetical protein
VGPLSAFREVWLVDFEFHVPDGARPARKSSGRLPAAPGRITTRRTTVTDLLPLTALAAQAGRSVRSLDYWLRVNGGQPRLWIGRSRLFAPDEVRRALEKRTAKPLPATRECR